MKKRHSQGGYTSTRGRSQGGVVNEKPVGSQTEPWERVTGRTSSVWKAPIGEGKKLRLTQFDEVIEKH